MVNGGFYRNVNCYFTNEGRTTFAKQNNGIKFSKLGAVVFSDKNNALINAIKAEDLIAINNITLKQLNEYTQLIFGNIKYEYIGDNTYTPSKTDDVNKSINNAKNYLPIEISYERKSDEDYISYDFTLKTDTLNIEKTDYDDLNFDGFALLGIPYKQNSDDFNDNFIEEQTPTVLAIIYFEDDTEKLQILHNQSDVAAMTVELHISLEDEIYLGAIKEYVDTMGNPVENNIATRNFVGLRQVNDGQNNRNSNVVSHGSDANLFISNMSTDTTTAYDSFAKLNIMTEAVNDLTSAIPQIMLAQTTSGVFEKSWNGDRLNITYNSGNEGGYFSISEITGNYRNKLNAEFFGANNIYHTVVTGVYGNSFIYSKNNKLTDNNNNHSFIHSDYNTFENEDMSNFGFINSNFNIVRATTGDSPDQIAYAKNNTLYNSNNNVFHPKYHDIFDSEKNTHTYKKGLISNSVLVNSQYNYLKGRSTVPYKNTDYYEPNLTFINSLSSFYNLHEYKSTTMIGSTFSIINDTTGNIIGIGEGLLQNGGEGDKIILGNYNRNSTDANEVLIVGDGRMKMNYVKGLVSAIPNWNTKLQSYQTIFRNISGDGSTAKDADFYRHNIFTVNKEGYITISDYDTNQSARYGFSGITAYDSNGKTTYDIPFEAIYNQIDTDRYNKERNSDLLLCEYAANDLIQNSPKTTAVIVNNYTDSTQNIVYSAYVNTIEQIIYTRDSGSVKNLNPLENYKIYTFTYYPLNNTTLPMCLIWHNRKPGHNDFSCHYSLVNPYESKRLMFLSSEDSTALSGFVEIS
jgi:hypothetical protein